MRGNVEGKQGRQREQRRRRRLRRRRLRRRLGASHEARPVACAAARARRRRCRDRARRSATSGTGDRAAPPAAFATPDPPSPASGPGTPKTRRAWPGKAETTQGREKVEHRGPPRRRVRAARRLLHGPCRSRRRPQVLISEDQLRGQQRVRAHRRSSSLSASRASSCGAHRRGEVDARGNVPFVLGERGTDSIERPAAERENAR